MHLSQIFIYPVKSLRGCAAEAAELDEMGLVGDRRFLVVDPQGNFLTQRALPRMALIATALSAGRLELSAGGSGSVSVPRAAGRPAPDRRRVTVWKDESLETEDCGDEAAAWLSDFLRQPCRLVRAGAAFRRRVPERKLPPGLASGPGHGVAFNDAYPFLLLGEATWHDLNDRLIGRGEEAVPLDRFRANLIIAGAAAGAEDGWSRIRIGRATLHGAAPCARCVITTTDQLTGDRGPEPLRTLALYRRDAQDPNKVNFGRNFIHETKSGALRRGETVELL